MNFSKCVMQLIRCLNRGSEFTVRGDYNYEKKNN